MLQILAGKHQRKIIQDIFKRKGKMILKFIVYCRDALEWFVMESMGSVSASVLGRSSMVLKIPASYYFSGSPHQKYFTSQTVEYFSYLGSVVTSDARCTREIKSMIAMAKAEFNKKKTLFTSKLDFNLRKDLVKCYIWSIALYGAETWARRKVDEKCLESVEMWCW
jgi:hypothetical protein